MVVQIGLISPPVGMNMFVLNELLPGDGDGDIFRGSGRSCWAWSRCSAILVAFPSLSVALPALLKL